MNRKSRVTCDIDRDFVLVPSVVFKIGREISPIAKVVLITLLSYCDLRTGVWNSSPGKKKLSNDVNCSIPTLSKALLELKEKGLVKIIHHRSDEEWIWECNEYELFPDPKYFSNLSLPKNESGDATNMNCFLKNQKAIEQKGKGTKPESILKSILQGMNLKFLSQRCFKNIGRVDFFLPNFMIVLEADGNYWHNYPDGLEQDRIRDLKLREMYGIDTIRFWESELNKSKEICIERLKKRLSNCNVHK